MAKMNVTFFSAKDYENEPPLRPPQNKPNLSRRSLLATPKCSTKPGWQSRIKPNLSQRSRSEAQIPAGGLLEILRPGTKQNVLPPAKSHTKPGWRSRIEPNFKRPTFTSGGTMRPHPVSLAAFATPDTIALLSLDTAARAQ